MVKGPSVTEDRTKFPTWMVVVAIIVLIPLIVVGLSAVMHIAAATSIGGVLLIVGFVALFIWAKKQGYGD
jgi:uncharacterized membrane protein YgdD (TMEM256/DUF423 family)